jgi:hypothetical protein
MVETNVKPFSVSRIVVHPRKKTNFGRYPTQIFRSFVNSQFLVTHPVTLTIITTVEKMSHTKGAKNHDKFKFS